MYRCESNHCFDRAKSGYVNLLVDNQKNSKLPGDNKLMVDARNSFLSKEYYAPLLNALSATLCSHIANTNCIILDVGCGEGYYTTGLFRYLEAQGKSVQLSGIDISKLAIEKAAKRCHQLSFVVASAFHLPIKSRGCDILLNLFAPYCNEEFLRVLKDDGLLIMVIPSENHLWELKEAVYSLPYKNAPKGYGLDGFTLIENSVIKDKILVDNSDDLQALFTMTPYYYKTSKEDFGRLRLISKLDISVEFEILVYKKN